MTLKVNKERFAVKYAIFYTMVVFVILFFPFLIYANYLYSLEEAKTEIALKKTAITVINEMEKYSSSTSPHFNFPRFKKFTSGIYDSNYNPIFTLIEANKNAIANVSEGYQHLNNDRIYTYKFKNSRYFGAKYLLVLTQFDNFTIIKNMIIVMFCIISITFLLSLFILKNFAKPFQEMNEALDNFIKDSMHEINTPLSIININVDMYNEKFGPNKYFSRIKSASKILSKLYNDMNYLIKEQTINRKAHRREIDFSAFVLKSVDYFKDIAELKGIEIVSHIEENIFIDFIPAKLQKIVDNTLSNAIKYGKEEREVIVILKIVEPYIVLSIEDFGIGIKEPNKIFSRYYREEETKGGFGIGLSIVNKIIHDENIKVKVTSQLNNGTTFEYFFKIKMHNS
ncbi:MAG: HAMP domain-containing sensor histidine kinase [Arcobacteraceae bacterium]